MIKFFQFLFLIKHAFPFVMNITYMKKLLKNHDFNIKIVKKTTDFLKEKELLRI